MFTGSPCPLCEEECEKHCLALGVNEQQRNIDEAEQKRDHKIGSIDEEKKEEGTEMAERVAKVFVDTDDEYNHEEGVEFEMGESKVEMTEKNKSKCDNGKGNDVSGDLVPPPQEQKSVQQLDTSDPVNLLMVCEESVESSVNEELLLCPAKSLSFSQTSLISSPPPSQNPLPLTLPSSNHSVFQLQTQPVVQTQSSVPMPMPQVSCLTKRAYESSPSVEPKTLTHSGQLEVTLQQVYTTRRYTRFTSRSASLNSIHPETSAQPLPCVSNTSLLVPAPKKKTRTSYSTGE